MAATTRGKSSLLIGSYTQPLGHVPRPKGKGVTRHVIEEDAFGEAGECLGCLSNPASLLVHPSKTSFYAASETSDEATASISRVEVDTFKVRETQLARGSAPCSLALSAGCRWLLCANYGTGSVTVLPVDPVSGAFTGSLARVVALVGDPGPRKDRQEQAHAHFVLCEGQRVLVSDLGCDCLHVYSLNEENGDLDRLEELACHFPPGTGPRHIARVDAEHIVVTGELSNEIYLCRLEEREGFGPSRTWNAIRIVQSCSCFEAQVRNSVSSKDSLHTMAHVACHEDLVFASNWGMDCICVFRYSKESETLQLIQRVATLRVPRHFAVMQREDGVTILVVAGQDEDKIDFHEISAREEETPLGELMGKSLSVGTPVWVEAIYHE